MSDRQEDTIPYLTELAPPTDINSTNVPYLTELATTNTGVSIVITQTEGKIHKSLDNGGQENQSGEKLPANQTGEKLLPVSKSLDNGGEENQPQEKLPASKSLNPNLREITSLARQLLASINVVDTTNGNGVQQIHTQSIDINSAYRMVYNYYFGVSEKRFFIKRGQINELDVINIINFLRFCASNGFLFKGLNIKYINNLLLIKNNASKIKDGIKYILFNELSVSEKKGDLLNYLSENVRIDSTPYSCNITVIQNSNNDIKEEDIVSFLFSKGIIFGIKLDDIKNAINNPGNTYEVASQLKSIPGKNEELEEVEVLSINPSIVGTNSLTKTANSLPKVKKGALLYRINPPSEGTAGMTIFGVRTLPKEPTKFDEKKNLGEGVEKQFVNGAYYIVAKKSGIVNSINPNPRTIPEKIDVSHIGGIKISVSNTRYENRSPLTTTGSINAADVDIFDEVPYSEETTGDYVVTCNSYSNEVAETIAFSILSKRSINIPNASIIAAYKVISSQIGDIRFKNNVSCRIYAPNGTVAYSTSANGIILGNKVEIGGSADNSFVFGNTINLASNALFTNCVFYVTTPSEAIKLAKHSSISDPEKNNTVVYLKGIKFEDVITTYNGKLIELEGKKNGLEEIIDSLVSSKKDTSSHEATLQLIKFTIEQLKKVIADIKNLDKNNSEEELKGIGVKIIDIPKGATHLGDLKEQHINVLKSPATTHLIL